jgi:nitrogen-specific signal transduction histidine kinase
MSLPIDHFVAIFEDITKRKKMEEELLRTQKLESICVLAGGIAHDFNNILTTIIGNVSMAVEQVAPEDEIYDLLGEAVTASTRAKGLTKQLLTFAKGGVPVKKATSIKKLLEESSSFVLRGSKSKCEFAIADDLWPVEVDIDQVSQVIHNVVINADQPCRSGGSSRLRQKKLRFGGNEKCKGRLS